MTQRYPASLGLDTQLGRHTVPWKGERACLGQNGAHWIGFYAIIEGEGKLRPKGSKGLRRIEFYGATPGEGVIYIFFLFGFSYPLLSPWLSASILIKKSYSPSFSFILQSPEKNITAINILFLSCIRLLCSLFFIQINWTLKFFFLKKSELLFLTGIMALSYCSFRGSQGQWRREVTLSTLIRIIFTGKYGLTLAFLYYKKNLVKIKYTYRICIYNFTYWRAIIMAKVFS